MLDFLKISIFFQNLDIFSRSHLLSRDLAFLSRSRLFSRILDIFYETFAQNDDFIPTNQWEANLTTPPSEVDINNHSHFSEGTYSLEVVISALKASIVKTCKLIWYLDKTR